MVAAADGKQKKGKVLTVMGHLGLERVEVAEARAGDIVCITGIDGLSISDTMCDPLAIESLPPLSVDEPTVSMTFSTSSC